MSRMTIVNTLCLFLVLHSLADVQTQAKGGQRRAVHQYDHCPNGSLRHDNSCYLIVRAMTATWVDAFVYCQAIAGHLVNIEDESEQYFLEAQTKAIDNVANSSVNYYWIGGTDLMSDGEFYWSPQMTPVDELYTNWNTGEPYDSSRHTPHRQDCMAMLGHSGKWDDGTCDTYKMPFICEIDLMEPDASHVLG